MHIHDVQTTHWSRVGNVLCIREATQTHFNGFGRIDKINSVQAVFLHPGPDGEDVRVKYDVIWVKAQFSHKEVVGPGAHLDFRVCFCRLEKGARGCH